MRFARPPEGFRIEMTERAQVTLDSSLDAIPRLAEVWQAIKDRLKFTAHREGQTLKNGRQIFQSQGDAAFGIPTIAVRYVVLGDRVVIEGLLIRV